MKKYRVTATASVQVVTIVEAENEEQAIQEAADRETDICIHGSEFAEGEASNTDFVPVDASTDSLTNFETIEHE